jgi:hypothetical protein
MTAKAVLHSLSLVALITWPPTVMAQAAGDRLKIEGIIGGDRVVVMGDARRNAGASGCGNDIVLRSTGDTALPNLRTAAGCNSEIAIFAADNAMLLETPVNTWTDRAGDIHTASLQPVVKVPVSVWIADATAGAETRASRDLERANVLYRQNKVGVKFHATFKDVSGDATAVTTIGNGVSAPTPTNISCTDAITALQRSAFYTRKTLNVYYVNLVFTGRNCAIKQTPTDCTNFAGFPEGDGNITYIGTSANRASLAHEFGHAFGLRPGPCGGHTETVAGFGPENIMWGGGDGDRSRFTLGQVFRMNTHTDRWGGTMLLKNELRPGPGRACLPLKASATCPALKKDWARP